MLFRSVQANRGRRPSLRAREAAEGLADAASTARERSRQRELRDLKDIESSILRAQREIRPGDGSGGAMATKRRA